MPAANLPRHKSGKNIMYNVFFLKKKTERKKEGKNERKKEKRKYPTKKVGNLYNKKRNWGGC